MKNISNMMLRETGRCEGYFGCRLDRERFLLQHSLCAVRKRYRCYLLRIIAFAELLVPAWMTPMYMPGGSAEPLLSRPFQVIVCVPGVAALLRMVRTSRPSGS